MSVPLNFLTARPMLEYMLGLEGFEISTIRPDEALPIFFTFLALPQDLGLTDVSLQTNVIWERTLGGTVTLSLVARYPNHTFPDAADPIYRTIGLSWTYDLPTDSCPISEGELWQGDFSSSEGFRAGIEGSASWQWAVFRTPAGMDVVSQDD